VTLCVGEKRSFYGACLPTSYVPRGRDNGRRASYGGLSVARNFLKPALQRITRTLGDYRLVELHSSLAKLKGWKMHKVTAKDFDRFRDQHNIEKTSMSVTETFPCGAWNKIYKLGYNRKVDMCMIMHTPESQEPYTYYIF
jgi:hypothetical protein